MKVRIEIADVYLSDKDLVDFLSKNGFQAIDSVDETTYFIREVEVEEKDIDSINIDFDGVEKTYERNDAYRVTLYFSARERRIRLKKKEIDEILRKNKGILVLRTTTLADTWIYPVYDIWEIFEQFPNIKVIIDKAEDTWESGVSIWGIYFQDGRWENVYECDLENFLEKIKEEIGIEERNWNRGIDRD